MVRHEAWTMPHGKILVFDVMTHDYVRVCVWSPKSLTEVNGLWCHFWCKIPFFRFIAILNRINIGKWFWWWSINWKIIWRNSFGRHFWFSEWNNFNNFQIGEIRTSKNHIKKMVPSFTYLSERNSNPSGDDCNELSILL